MLQSEVISVTDHNHGPEPEINEVTKVQSVIRKWALAGVEKPRQIILHARTGIPLEAVPHLPPYSTSQRTINRQRKKEADVILKSKDCCRYSNSRDPD